MTFKILDIYKSLGDGTKSQGAELAQIPQIDSD